MRDCRGRDHATAGPVAVAAIAGTVVTLLLATGCSAPVRPRATAPAPSRTVGTGSTPFRPGASGGTGTGDPAPSGCGHPAPAAVDRVVSFAVDPAAAEGQRTRTALVHVPAGYRPQSPHPVLLVYHGHGGNPAETAAGTGFRDLADRKGFFAVYPQGLPDGPDGPPMWASAGAVDHGIQELPAARSLLDTLAADYCIDAARIYATGISNGGGMANYLACRLADRITAVAPVVGNMYWPKDGGCQPTRAVSILDIHAVDDPVVSYQGSRADPAWMLPAVTDWLAGWAALDHCPTTPAVPVDTAALQVRQWTGCADGSAIVAYRVMGGHRWPPSLVGSPTASVIWDFLAGHRMPASTR